jgi:ferrous iron transport protein B
MARIAYMLDRVLRWFGLHGNSVMAMIISGGITGGCAVPGVMATRTLRDPKERIATLLVVPFMNCGAKLPVYAMLIAAFFPQHKARMLFLLTLLSWAFALFAAKFVRATVLRGEKTPFVMELPPYRAPTFQGLLIHTWERTWQYIKKAGTIILAFSIILWAMMTFPGPSEDRIRAFQERRSELGKELLASPAVAEWVGDEAGLQRLNTLYEDYGGAVGSDEGRVPALMARDPLFPFVKGIFRAQKGREANRDVGAGQREAVSRYLHYRVQMNQVEMEQHQAALDETVAGWIGHALESVTRPLGFDYRVNISLAGGFAAKEVIISTLGTAYSLGETEPGDTGTLGSRLRRDPNWNPLQGFTLIVFTMLYVPCFATVIAIRRESSWRWALFSIAFNLLVAYGVALMIRQAGRALGLGV